MSVPALAQNVYGSHARTIKTPRDIEYEVLAGITRGMQTASADKGPAGFPALAAAMHENRRLWMAFAVDLADSGNAFPADLRGRLFYLAQFVSQHTDKVLAGEAPAGVLVDINLSVMRGLRARGEQQ